MANKPLSEMTNEELWQLFPIILCPHSDEWKNWYADEYNALAIAMPEGAYINHIGSTYVSSIWAKPTVDILVEVALCDFSDAQAAIPSCGYGLTFTEKTRTDYHKGYTESGFAARVFHLHLRVWGDNDELYFRDYLTAHPSVAQQYEALKLGLWRKYEFNRDAYTDAKGEFVKKFTNLAKAEYSGRYDR